MWNTFSRDYKITAYYINFFDAVSTQVSIDKEKLWTPLFMLTVCCAFSELKSMQRFWVFRGVPCPSCVVNT